VVTKTRVLVVDDSAVIRRAISDLLAGDPEIEVIGQASNGNLALVRMVELKPDVVTLDVEMPVMDGLETLREMKKAGISVPVIMCSTLTERGAVATLDALSLGAACYVTKPSSSGSATESIENLRRDLLPKVKALGAHHNRYVAPQRLPAAPAPSVQVKPAIVAAPIEVVTAQRHPTTAPAAAAPSFTAKERPKAPPTAPAEIPPHRPVVPPAPVLAPKSKGTGKIEAVIIGVSTGGPNALAVVLPSIPLDFPVPVLIVQHMPPVFTKLVADRLNNQSPLSVREACENEAIRTGSVLIAPGDFHMVMEKSGADVRVRLNQSPAVNFCRPAVDVMFKSAVEVYGGNLLAVILTGMGSDGAIGCQMVRDAGGQVIVQDAASSVVWGMPGAVAERGIAEAILPLGDIAKEIVRRVTTSRRV